MPGGQRRPTSRDLVPEVEPGDPHPHPRMARVSRVRRVAAPHADPAGQPRLPELSARAHSLPDPAEGCGRREKLPHLRIPPHAPFDHNPGHLGGGVSRQAAEWSFEKVVTALRSRDAKRPLPPRATFCFDEICAGAAWAAPGKSREILEAEGERRGLFWNLNSDGKSSNRRGQSARRRAQVPDRLEENKTLARCQRWNLTGNA